MRTDTCNKPHTLRDAVTGRNRNSSCSRVHNHRQRHQCFVVVEILLAAAFLAFYSALLPTSAATFVISLITNKLDITLDTIIVF